MSTDYIILWITACAGGAINSVAGGGTLLTFPVLFAALGGTAEASVLANGTSTVSLVPAAIAAMWGYRKELVQEVPWLRLLALPSLVGGILGALLVTQLDPAWFAAAVPWLILTAALLFALQPSIARWTGIGQPHGPPSKHAAIGIIFFQFLVAIYGGYFGAGIGILMLSGLAMMGMADIHRMNAVKSFLGIWINGAAVAIFIANGQVQWPMALSMAVASSIGGYGGARLARRLDKNLVRRMVVLIGFALASYYFYRQFSAWRTPTVVPGAPSVPTATQPDPKT